jgi:hypothetical protein
MLLIKKNSKEDRKECNQEGVFLHEAKDWGIASE